MIVSPVPWMVTGLVTSSADAPAGWGSSGVLAVGLPNEVSVAVPPRTSGAKTMVSSPGNALALSIASRKLPGPESFRLVSTRRVRSAALIWRAERLTAALSGARSGWARFHAAT